MGFERELDTLKNIRKFFDSIGIKEFYNEDSDFRNSLKTKYKDIDASSQDTYFIDALAKDVKKAHFKSEYYSKNNSLEWSDFRNNKFRDDGSRVALRNEILNCCLWHRRNINDDNTSNRLDCDGLGPYRGDLKFENKAFLIIGGPACGKSTYANVIADEFGAYLLDSDIIKRKFPEFKLRGSSSASLLHEESKFVYEKFLNIVKESGVNIVTPVIGKNYESLKDSVEAYENKGYKVYLILVKLDKVKATLRALKRYVTTNRYVPLNYVLDICGHESVASFYRLACLKSKLSVLAIDNTEKPGKIEFHRGVNSLISLLEKEKVIR